MTEIDLTSFPLVSKGHKFEDFSVGQEFAHHWGRTITTGDNTLFCTAIGQFLPLQLNAEFARGAGHPEVVVSPMLVLCTVVGLSVEDLSEAGGPFLGLDNCRFIGPVYPGDTLEAHSTVLSTRLSERFPRSGIVSWRTSARNQKGELVVEFERTNLVAKRNVTA